MQKRGQTRLTWTVLGLIVAGIMIGITAIIIANFGGIFLSTSADRQAATNNFNILTKSVQGLLDNPAKFAPATIRYNIPEDFILVGFDKNWKGDQKGSWATTCYSEPITKPSQCKGKACLCLYENTAGQDFGHDGWFETRSPDDVVDKCVVFEGDISFFGPADNYYNFDRCEGEDIIFKENDYDNDCSNDGAKKQPTVKFGKIIHNYEFLVVYGDCDGEWGIKTLYIEKYKEQDSIYIFISQKTNKIKAREEQMTKDFTS